MTKTASTQLSSIGPYQFERLVGSGATGTVFKARDDTGQPVAVKVLHPHLIDETYRLRFQREAEVVLTHPNVIRVLDTGSDPNGMLYIVFELLEGETIDAVMAHGAMSAADAINVGLQTCTGLTAAHKEGVIHRDLKPANIFQCSDGTIKLLDFGMALLTTKATRLTLTEAILGTPAYLSPEQARGDMNLDPQTDVWALGAILYEALSGRLPFGRDTVFATIVAIRMDELIPLSVVAPTVPPGLSAVVERALAKDKSNRWASADEFSSALQKADLTPGEPVDPNETSGWLIEPGESRVVAVVLAEGVHDEALISQAVESRGGVALSVIGDRTIGVFGSDTWEGDELLQAARAGWQARKAAKTMAIASGRAEAAGRAISGAVLTAAETGCEASLEGLAVDVKTARYLEPHFIIREVTPSLREITAPNTEFRSTHIAGIPTADLVGRDAEIDQVRYAVEAVCDEERATAVVVTGSPGIGKSRLFQKVEELVERFDPPVEVLRGFAESHQREMGLSLIRNVLENRLQVELATRNGAGSTPAEPSDRAAGVFKIVEKAFENKGRAQSCAEFLGTLLDVELKASSALEAAHRDPQLVADRLRVAIQDYFEGTCKRGPLVLMLEDLQWADDASLDLLEDLLSRLAEYPFLIIATARVEFEQSRPDLFASGDVVRLSLRGLTSPDVAKLIRSKWSGPLPSRFVRAITQHTQGNPFFVEQIVAALTQKGWSSNELSSFPLPLTVQAAVQSRLDHLSSDEKRLCRIASVIGRAFYVDETKALGVADPEPLLGSLCRHNILVARGRSAFGRGRKYRFKTNLIENVAYQMLAEDFRGELHLRLGAYLATLSDSDPEEVANHYERGREASKAADFYRGGAFKAARIGDVRTVLRCSQKALDLGTSDVSRFALHMVRADVLRFQRKRQEQWKELVAAAGYAANDAERARVMIDQAVCLARIGESEKAVATAEEAVTYARAGADEETLALTLCRQVTPLAYSGRLAEAEEVLAEALSAVETLSPQVRALAASSKAQVASTQGDLGKRRFAFEESASLFAEAGDIRRQAGAECNLADVYNRFGAYEEARNALYAAIEGCRRVGNRLMEGYALLNLGYSLGMLDQFDEALQALHESATLAGELGERRLEVATDVYRARVLLRASQLDEAAAVAERAATEAAEAHVPTLEVLALTVLARADLDRGMTEAALAHSTAAMKRRDDVGSVEEDEAEVFLVHAQILAADGKTEAATAIRTRAVERLRELGDQIADPQWRARFFNDVPAHREILSLDKDTDG